MRGGGGSRFPGQPLGECFRGQGPAIAVQHVAQVIPRRGAAQRQLTITFLWKADAKPRGVQPSRSSSPS
jgi:hypothetical protein